MGVTVALAAGRGGTGAGELEARSEIEPTYEDLQSRRFELPKCPNRAKQARNQGCSGRFWHKRIVGSPPVVPEASLRNYTGIVPAKFSPSRRVVPFGNEP